MAQIKKFALIPEELVTKHTVSNKRLSELDKAMMKILHSDLPDHEKLVLYHELLKKSLNLQEFNHPVEKKNEEVADNKKIDEKKNEEMKNEKVVTNKDSFKVKDNYQDLILSSVSKSMRRKAENALSLIKTQPDVLSWNAKGQIAIHGEKLPNSNIIDFFNYMYNTRSNALHKSLYDTTLKDLNVPKHFIGNKNLLKSPVQRKLKRVVKAPIKWASFI